MAFRLSAVRAAVQDQDLERLEKALNRPVSDHVLQEAFVDLLGPSIGPFRSQAFAMLRASGLDIGAIPAVTLEQSQGDSFSERDGESMRLPYDWMFASEKAGMPLVSRAAMANLEMMEDLLHAGANPRSMHQLSAKGAKSTRPPLVFGSAWGSALALSGRPIASQALLSLQKHDPAGWGENLDLVKDVLRAIIRPGTHKAPPAQKWGLTGARMAWELIQEKTPDWPREKWARLWADSVAWRSLSTRAQDRARLALLAQVLPPVPLGGLFDACHQANWDLREVALEAGLEGDPGCWNALERHAEDLGLADRPTWGHQIFAWKDAAGTQHKQTVPMDGLACLLLKVRWPARDKDQFERADAWLEHLRPGAALAPEGRTLMQWRMMGTKGAPVAWLARHPEWWAPHPKTGRTPWHEPEALSLSPRLPPGFTPDWSAVDGQGQEAGATALALATTNKETAFAIKALNEDRLWANGDCLGRHASTWVAYHPELKKAYRASCQKRGFKPPRGAQSRWRLHSAAQAMSPTRVRAILERMDPASRQQALLETDELGRTPLLWWVATPAQTRQDGLINKAWGGRAERTFALLAPPGVDLWKEGMAKHPFVEMVLGDNLMSPMDKTEEMEQRLAQDFGARMKDKKFRDIFLPQIIPPMTVRSVAGMRAVWESWRPDSDARREVLVSLWGSWKTGNEQVLWKNRLVSTTLGILEKWEKEGVPLSSEDLQHPDVTQVLERLQEKYPDEAEVILKTPIVEAALHAQAMEKALPEPSDAPSMRPGSRMRF